MVKNSMNIIDVYAWIKRWGKKVEGCYIDNIYHLNRHVLLFKLRSKLTPEPIMLLLEAGKRIHFTKYVQPRNSKISPLCMAFRKRLRNKAIEKIELLGWERIIKLTTKSAKEVFFVYVELLPRGIIVLTDENNVIIQATAFITMKDRAIKPKHKYSLPPCRGINPLEASVDEIVKTIPHEKNIIKSLVKGLGLPGEFAEEVCFRAKVSKEKLVKYLVFEDFIKIKQTLENIVNESIKGKGYIVRKAGFLETVLPYVPLRYQQSHEYEVLEYSDFNSALDEYFTSLYKEARIREAKQKKEDEIIRLQKSLERAIKFKEEYERNALKYRSIGEVILKNLNSLNAILKCFRDKKVRKMSIEKAISLCLKGLENIEILELIRDKGKLKVKIDSVKIELDLRASAYENAAKYFNKAKEMRRKASKINEKVDELRNKLEELRYEEETIVTEEKAKIKPREWFEKYHWVLSEDGYLVIGGKDAYQNESIVKKILNPDDVFVHADIHGGSAVIIKAKGNVSEKALREAVRLAAVYSRAWKEGYASIDVYWVWGSQVSKRPPPGEYLTKGAFMIYGKKNYIRNVPLEIALGFEKVNDNIRVIVGTEEHVKNRTLAYVILIPGNKDPSRLAKEIKEAIMRKLPNNMRPLLNVLSIMEIASKIPGKSSIRKVVIRQRYDI